MRDSPRPVYRAPPQTGPGPGPGAQQDVTAVPALDGYLGRGTGAGTGGLVPLHPQEVPPPHDAPAVAAYPEVPLVRDAAPAVCPLQPLRAREQTGRVVGRAGRTVHVPPELRDPGPGTSTTRRIRIRRPRVVPAPAVATVPVPVQQPAQLRPVVGQRAAQALCRPHQLLRLPAAAHLPEPRPRQGPGLAAWFWEVRTRPGEQGGGGTRRRCRLGC